MGYHQKESLADNLVKMMADQPEMSYQKAYAILKTHAEVFEEAVRHLNHNAAIEKESDKLIYVL